MREWFIIWGVVTSLAGWGLGWLSHEKYQRNRDWSGPIPAGTRLVTKVVNVNMSYTDAGCVCGAIAIEVAP